MIAYLVADFAYLGIVVCDLGAMLLALEWLTHFLPGEALNPFRRVLFRVTFPFLKFSDQFFPTKWGTFNSRGLIMAAFLIALSRYGMPWLVLLSFSMRG